MSTQVHAPPTPAEDKGIQDARRARGESAPEVMTWSTVDGWCSACKTENVLVAHMGHHEFNFALCQDCVSRLQVELGSPTSSEGGGG